jgi:hypothetical protein
MDWTNAMVSGFVAFPQVFPAKRANWGLPKASKAFRTEKLGKSIQRIAMDEEVSCEVPKMPTRT